MTPFFCLSRTIVSVLHLWMELKELIRAWFKDNCHFGTGVNLLQQTQRHPVEVQRFRSYFTAHFVPAQAEKQLQQLLRMYLESQPVASVLVENHAFVGNSIKEPPEMSEILANVQNIDKTAAEPVEIQKLRETAKEWHKKQSYVHAQMGLVESDEERYACAEQLMEEIIPTLDRIYDQIRAFEKDGTLPAPAAVNDVARQAVEDYKRMEKTLRPRISRLKKWIDKGLNDKKRVLSASEIEKYKKELVEKELEFQTLKNKLGL